MALNNQLPAKNNNGLSGAALDTPAIYEAGGEQVKLSANMVRKYLVNGDGNVTEQEVVMFINLCKFQHLNPFLREAYLIKYGSSPATMVTGKDVFTKRAKRNPHFAGMSAGIFVTKGDELIEREGAMALPGEQIVGGWAKVYMKEYAQPIYAAAGFEEYAGRKKDGSLNAQWASKPATMIRKVALVQALREAFPEDFEGLYSPEEIKEANETLNYSTAPIRVPETIEAPVEEAPITEDPASVLFGGD